MNKKVLFLSISILSLVFFFVFSVVVKKHSLDTFDFNTTVHFQDHTPLGLDKIYPVFSFLASIQSMSVLLIVLLLFRKKLNGIYILLLFYASHAVELFGKVFIHHPPPPFMFYKHLDATSMGFEKSYVQAGSSYPSGHSFRVVFVAILFAYTVYMAKRLSPPIKIILLSLTALFVTLVCISRVSLGEHWSTDVIGGVLFAVGMGFIGLLVIEPRRRDMKPVLAKNNDTKLKAIHASRKKLLEELKELDKLEKKL